VDSNADNIRWYVWVCGALIGMIGSIFGAGAAMMRFKLRLSRLEDAVIDKKNNTPKVVCIDACQNQMSSCMMTRTDRRKEDRETLTRELQNIHKSLAAQGDRTANLEKLIAAMPVTIVKEMKAMGVLKDGVSTKV
jgi:hypothetical protein